MMLFRMLTSVVLFGAALAPTLALAGQVDTVYIAASRDVTLYEDSLGSLANGAGQHFFAGQADSTGFGFRRRSLLHFDVAASVPADAYIADAAVTLNMSGTVADTHWVGLHRVYSMWVEGASNAPGEEEFGVPSDSGDATWIHSQFPAALWGTPGGDFNNIYSGWKKVAGVGTYTFTSMYVAADVQVWLDTPSVNYGWLVLGNESAPGTVKRFDSREHPTPANQPVLMVIYATPTWTTIPPLADNTLYEHPTGSLSNGAGEFMFSGRTSDVSNSVRRGLIDFYIWDSVTIGAEIFDVRLLLHVTTPPDSNQVVSLHALTRNFVEGTSNATGTEEQGAPTAGSGATWLRYNTNCAGCFWSAPGGDFETTPLAASLVTTSAGTYEWRSDSLKAWVQTNNDGLIIKGDESQPGTLVRFDTRENSDPALRPVLQVVWSGGCAIGVNGDVNLSGAVTSADIIHLVNFIFKGSDVEPLPCVANGDVNCSGTVTSADIIRLVMFVFKGGPPSCDICMASPLAVSCNTGR